MCYQKCDVDKDTEKYNECYILFRKMIMERTKTDKKKVKIETINIKDKIYCRLNDMIFYCACFQTIGLNYIKLIHSPCTIICFSCTNPARKYAQNNNITILSSMLMHMFSMNDSRPNVDICNKREHEKYILRYGDLQFTPKITHKDPYIQYIGGKKGDLLRIYRKKNDSTYIYYRYVL